MAAASAPMSKFLLHVSVLTSLDADCNLGVIFDLGVYHSYRKQTCCVAFGDVSIPSLEDGRTLSLSSPGL